MTATRRNQPEKLATRPDQLRAPISATKILKPGATKSNTSQVNPKPKRRRGRPFKMPQKSLFTVQPVDATRDNVTPLSPPPRRLSILEALPVEVIEQIFLYSLNINFARASPVLAAAISSERIYRLLILLAFWDDPGEHPVSAEIKRILSPVDYDYIGRLPRGRRSLLQAQLFSCRWCTMERLLKQVPTLMVLTIHRKWLDTGITMEPNELKALQRFMKREDDSTLVFNAKGPLIFQFAQLLGPYAHLRHLDKNPYHVYKLRITPMTQVEIISVRSKIVTSTPALDLCAFPEKLLRGRKSGFTPQDVAFLEMLRMTSDNYKHIESPVVPCTDTIVNRTALHDGVRNAIETQNFNALISLLKIDEFLFRFKASNQGEPVYYTFPSEHFVQVTRVGREKNHLNVAFFEALLRASAESLPPTAQELVQWSVDNVRLAEENPSVYNEINSKFAYWLSNFMLRLPAQIDYAWDEPTGQLFTLGQLDLHDLEGCRFMDEVLQPNREPFGNWTAESTFRLEDLWVKKPDSS
ncbi:uncharacterized protein N7483_006242 [Penicillium malachiteum]|uniref:uncharacterized protein n=1 Tax=Penicillium malachiteum TaxID=1324776 RepID=UPI002546FC16|nr:uncharacterized protein N7483_006242 [Penicillium malachiteum]KAJ5731734.1 hypothetical protein N7483_006242 [Penicillium malachiteum]